MTVPEVPTWAGWLLSVWVPVWIIEQWNADVS
jgi:hypothetical protein